ncbi:MAG: 50S ribosomal protein L5 [Candidatus Pacearchaeota archaeon]|nr:50S ribosomal protein L5 [Candidatus Pacearchaeota archaeon]
MNNVMRDPKIKKVVLSAGATGNDLDKSVKLLELISERKPQVIKSGPRKRIPAFGVKPNMELGTSVTLRGSDAIALLRRLLGAIDNKLKAKQIDQNNFSFGIEEYINIPDTKYVREIGIRGFNVTVVFERAGTRVKIKKIKRGKIPKRQYIGAEEIIKFMKDKFNTEIE